MAQTQKQQVLEFMRKNGSITQLDAYEIGYITRLSGIIRFKIQRWIQHRNTNRVESKN